MIDNLINGNLTDAKRQAKTFGFLETDMAPDSLTNILLRNATNLPMFPVRWNCATIVHAPANSTLASGYRRFAESGANSTFTLETMEKSTDHHCKRPTPQKRMENVIIQYFQGNEVISAPVDRGELADLAGSMTFWLPDVLASHELERKGKVLKEKCRRRLFHNAVLTTK